MMARRNILLTISLMITGLCSIAQSIPEQDVIDFAVNPGGRLDEIGLPPAEVEGTGFLDEEWRLGSLKLYNLDTIGNLLLRYDVLNGYVEITRDREKIRIAHLSIIESFIFDNSRIFRNTRAFKPSSNLTSKLTGVFEVLYENGDVLFTRYYEVDKKQSTYVPAFDVGNRSEQLLLKDEDYLIKNGVYYKVPQSKNAFSKLMMEEFNVELKEKINPKKTDEVIAFINQNLTN
ncbi:MAG: hypothetical protein RJQ14_00985 [Marinoscillum sp.]